MLKTKAVTANGDADATLDKPAMQAAVYRSPNQIVVESLPIPEIGDSEILVRVTTCGVSGTDLKKIELGLVPPPRIFGHEIAGTVAQAGRNISAFKPGDRVAVR